MTQCATSTQTERVYPDTHTLSLSVCLSVCLSAGLVAGLDIRHHQATTVNSLYTSMKVFLLQMLKVQCCLVIITLNNGLQKCSDKNF